MQFLLGGLLISLALSSYTTLSDSFYKVIDYRAFNEGQQSRKLNTTDRYCLMYNNNRSKYNTRNFDPVSLDRQIATELENLGMNIKREELVTKTMTVKKSRQRRKTILAREKKHNYQNCNMLISHDLFTIKEENNCLSMDIYDLEWYGKVGSYQICNIVFQREKQAEFVKKAIQTFWEYQTKIKQKTATHTVVLDKRLYLY